MLRTYIQIRKEPALCTAWLYLQLLLPPEQNLEVRMGMVEVPKYLSVIMGTVEPNFLVNLGKITKNVRTWRKGIHLYEMRILKG